MRKYLYNAMLFAAVCLVGCQSEQLVEGNENGKNIRTVEIFADMGGEAASRTLLGSDGQLNWEEGDKLSVIMGKSTEASMFEISSDVTENPTAATFTGEVNFNREENPLANVAFYPYDSNIKDVYYNENKYSLTSSISAEQTWVEGATFSKDVYPMMAVTADAESTNFAFKNVLAGTQIHVSGNEENIVKVVMAVEGYSLAGAYTVAADANGIYSVTPGEGAVNSIELNCGDGVVLGEETVFTFVHFPMTGDAKKNITFTLYQDNGSLMTLNVPTTTEFKSTYFKHLPKQTYKEDFGTIWVADEENLKDAISNPEIDRVVLADDIKLTEILTIGEGVSVLDGNGKTLTSDAGRAINVSGVNGVTIQNLTIEASGERAINIIQGATNVTIDNVTATCKNYAVNVASSAGNAVVTIKNSNLTGLNVVNVAAADAEVTVENTVLNCKDNNPNESYTILTLNKDAENSKIFATGVDFNLDGSNNDSKIAGNSTYYGLIEINGSSNQVSEFDAYINYGDYHYSFETIKEAIEYANTGETVKLIRDVTIYEAIEIKEAITLELNGKKVTSTAKDAFRVSADATIQNGTIEGANRCINTRDAVVLTLENVNLKADKYSSAWGNPQPLTIGGTVDGTVVNMNNVNISAAWGYCIITFVETALNAKNCTAISGYNALYVKPGSDYSKFNFVNSVLSGSTKLVGDKPGNGFSTISVRADYITVNVDDASKVTADGNYMYALEVGSDYSGETTAKFANITIAGTITGNVLYVSDSSPLSGEGANKVLLPQSCAERLTGFETTQDGNLLKVTGKK